jgi:hypothetical protein
MSFEGTTTTKLRADARIPSMRLRELAEELGLGGATTIFDEFVRELSPRFVRPPLSGHVQPSPPQRRGRRAQSVAVLVCSPWLMWTECDTVE